MIKNIIIIVLVSVSILLTILLLNVYKTPEQNMPLAEETNSKVEKQEIVKKQDSVESIEEEPMDTSGPSLDLSGQKLSKLPSSVLTKTNLEVLDISNNNLTGALPAEIRYLQKLRVLDASDNQMTGVPAEVGQLKNLEILDLSNNQLTGLPYELGNLKNLKKLDLSGNDYAKQDLEIIKQGLPSDVELVL